MELGKGASEPPPWPPSFKRDWGTACHPDWGGREPGAGGGRGREDKYPQPHWKGPAPHHRHYMEDNTEAIPSVLSSNHKSKPIHQF